VPLRHDVPSLLVFVVVVDGDFTDDAAAGGAPLVTFGDGTVEGAVVDVAAVTGVDVDDDAVTFFDESSSRPMSPQSPPPTGGVEDFLIGVVDVDDGVSAILMLVFFLGLCLESIKLMISFMNVTK
jgi:hypothetical protein